MNLPDFLGKRIREARSAAGMKQLELAELLSLSTRAISAYEMGSREPSIYTLKRIADATFHPIDFFFEPQMGSPANTDLQRRIVRMESEIESIKEELNNRLKAAPKPASAA